MFAWRLVTTALTFVGSFVKEYLPGIGAFFLGKTRERNKQLEKDAENAKKWSDIDAKPFRGKHDVLKRMRRKSK